MAYAETLDVLVSLGREAHDRSVAAGASRDAARVVRRGVSGAHRQARVCLARSALGERARPGADSSGAMSTGLGTTMMLCTLADLCATPTGRRRSDTLALRDGSREQD